MAFKANEFDKPEYEFFDPTRDERFAWTPMAGDKTGQLSEIILSGSHESGWVTRLLKFEPNADTTVNGTFTQNSHGQSATARMRLASVGPAAAETAMITALIPMP